MLRRSEKWSSEEHRKSISMGGLPGGGGLGKRKKKKKRSLENNGQVIQVCGVRRRDQGCRRTAEGCIDQQADIPKGKVRSQKN